MRSDREVLTILNATPAITVVRRSAAQQAVHVYLTGRALRNLFLGLPPRNFDFIVERGADDLARQVATDAPGGAVSVDAHSGAVHYDGCEFGDLHFRPANGLSADQYLTRYSDFTVNTLLFDLQSDAIVDGYGACADLEQETVRSLPAPDRAARPAPFALRAIGTALLTPTFTLEAGTRADIEAQPHVLASADAGDVGFELNAILRSPHYLRGITLLSELGLLRRVFATFFPFAETPDAGDVTPFCRLLDEVIDPYRALVSRHLPVLRLVALLTAAMRRQGVNIQGDDGRRFLLDHGDRLEQACNDLSARFSSRGMHGFRVRMVTIAYWRGLAALADGTASIEDAIESSLSTFGPRKGLLSGLLIGTDWLLDQRAAGHAAPMERITAILQRFA